MAPVSSRRGEVREDTALSSTGREPVGGTTVVDIGGRERLDCEDASLDVRACPPTMIFDRPAVTAAGRVTFGCQRVYSVIMLCATSGKPRAANRAATSSAVARSSSARSSRIACCTAGVILRCP